MRPGGIDENLLPNIARMTGGRYSRARDAAALQNIYAQIDQMERTPVHSTTTVSYRELYRWPLLIGLLALFAALALGAWQAPLHDGLHAIRAMAVGPAVGRDPGGSDGVAG